MTFYLIYCTHSTPDRWRVAAFASPTQRSAFRHRLGDELLGFYCIDAEGGIRAAAQAAAFNLPVAHPGAFIHAEDCSDD